MAYRIAYCPIRRLLTTLAAWLTATTATPAFAGTNHIETQAMPGVSVSAKAPVTAITEQTYGGGQLARGARVGVLGEQEILDLPFSVTSYTSKMMEDQQARTLADVLEKDPGVRASFGFGNLAQSFTIRGFQLTGDDISLNGLYGVTPRQLVSTDMLERVDLFKGSNAFVNGVPPGGSGIGGGVNLQLKRAHDKPLSRITFDVSGTGQLGTHADVARRIGKDGQFGIRLNQTIRGGNTSIRDERRRENDTAVAVDFRGEKLRLSADFLYQRQQVLQGRSTVHTAAGLPQVPNATSNFAQPWSYSTMETTAGVVRAEYDFLPNWTAYASGGIQHANEQGQYASPHYDGKTGLSTARRMGVPRKDDSLTAQLGMHGAFSTGPLTHRINLGASIIQRNVRAAYTLSDSFPTSIGQATPVPRPADTTVVGNLQNPSKTGRTINKGISLSDTMGLFDDRLLFTVGARHQTISVDGYDYTGVQTAAYKQSVVTPVFGVVFKPLASLAIYANRSEALMQAGSAPADAKNRDETFAPFRSKQIEAGIKYDRGSFGATAAVFQITQPSAFLNSNNIYTVSGEQRNRGLEVSAFGEPVRGIRLLAGASLTDATLTRTGNADQGRTAVGVPRYLANLGVEYDLPQMRGLTLTGDWIYTSHQYLDSGNRLVIPASNRVDIGTRYATQIGRRKVTLRATVKNVANHAYWGSAYGGYLTMGGPRTFLASISTDF